jgi:hypothetical protein
MRKLRLHLKCACGGWCTVIGESNVELTAEAFGWLPNEDGSWTCPSCLDRAEKLAEKQ